VLTAVTSLPSLPTGQTLDASRRRHRLAYPLPLPCPLTLNLGSAPSPVPAVEPSLPSPNWTQQGSGGAMAARPVWRSNRQRRGSSCGTGMLFPPFFPRLPKSCTQLPSYGEGRVGERPTGHAGRVVASNMRGKRLDDHTSGHYPLEQQQDEVPSPKTTALLLTAPASRCPSANEVVWCSTDVLWFFFLWISSICVSIGLIWLLFVRLQFAVVMSALLRLLPCFVLPPKELLC
jgi:hypothetical protein